MLKIVPTGPGLQAQQPVQDVDQHPGLDVLARRLLQLELLRPLDVVALVLHVDAGPGDLQLVHDLDGLELDEARRRRARRRRCSGPAGCAARPPGRWAWPGSGRTGPRPHRGIRPGSVEQRAVDAKDGPVLLVFLQDPGDELVKRLNLHDPGHGPFLYRFPIVSAMTAFCTCRRFSAMS